MGIGGVERVSPPLPWSSRIIELAENRKLNLGPQSFTGKILSRRDLARFEPVSPAPLSPWQSSALLIFGARADVTLRAHWAVESVVYRMFHKNLKNLDWVHLEKLGTSERVGILRLRRNCAALRSCCAQDDSTGERHSDY